MNENQKNIPQMQETKEEYTAPNALVTLISDGDIVLNSLEIIPWDQSNNRNNW